MQPKCTSSGAPDALHTAEVQAISGLETGGALGGSEGRPRGPRHARPIGTNPWEVLVQLAQPGGGAPVPMRPATNCLKCTAFGAGLPAGGAQISRNTGLCDRRRHTLGHSRWDDDEAGGWQRRSGPRDGWQRLSLQGLRKMVTEATPPGHRS